MCSRINISEKMRDRFLNMIPIGTGSLGATSSVVLDVTWGGIGEMALQATIFAFVGGAIGWVVKTILDAAYKRKKKKK